MHPGDGDYRGTLDDACQLNEATPDQEQPAKTSARRSSRGPRATARSAKAEPAQAVSASQDGEIEGREVEPIRAGEDTRRRGWFWHWNSIITQFAPLIGLKGVGLLNSYTVWTDRRDESPHRGYAFPSQQSEAAFYGEDRAELIALNKILVALDLIEIRKEMVTRVDAQGRRWRVPHNLYRVKDHGDDYTLKSRDVLRVVELAERDRVVYRTIRHIFSDRFAPIDGQNVWWSILDELAGNELWQKLAAKATADERRASARTKAGHAARKERFLLPSDGDTATPGNDSSDSATVASSTGDATNVATINNGLDNAVAPGNKGSKRSGQSTVDQANQGQPSSVAQANTIKDQEPLTTTTTSGQDEERDTRTSPEAIRDDGENVTVATVSHTEYRDTSEADAGAGPGGRIAPLNLPAEQAAIRAFEDANGRSSTPAERHLLRDIARGADTAAQTQGGPGASGWSWLTAAIYEAVESGSSFVAPRRLREIIGRWTREGAPDALRAAADVPAPVATGAAAITSLLGEGTEFSLPHGFGSRRTWAFAVERAASALDLEAATDLFRGTSLVRYHEGEATIAVIDRRQAGQLSGGYRGVIERALSEAMRRPVRIAVIAPELDDNCDARLADPEPGEVPDESGERAPDEPVTASFEVTGSGMTNDQVWAAALDELAASGEIPPANLAAWIRPARLIGERPDGVLVIGAPHAPARRRIGSHFVLPIESALGRVLGRDARIEVVVGSRYDAAETPRQTPFFVPGGEQAGG